MMDGFRLFFRLPAHFYVSLIAHLVGFIAVAWIPIVGSVAAAIAFPLFSAGYFAAGDALRRTSTPDISVMFDGFSKKPTQLLAVGALQFVGMLACLVIGGAVGGFGFFMSMMRGGTPDITRFMEVQVLIGMLVYLMLIIPVTMAAWFAPALVLLHDVAPVEAMKQSFQACMKNFVPFLVYSLVAGAAIILAFLPLLLGLFVVIPALVASFYPQYASIFTVKDEAQKASVIPAPQL